MSNRNPECFKKRVEHPRKSSEYLKKVLCFKNVLNVMCLIKKKKDISNGIKESFTSQNSYLKASIKHF